VSQAVVPDQLLETGPLIAVGNEQDLRRRRGVSVHQIHQQGGEEL
jgi:hypothetical protein